MKKSLWIRVPALILSVFTLLSAVGCDILLEEVMVAPPTDTADANITDTDLADTNIPPEGNDSVFPSETHTEIATQAPADTEGLEDLAGIKPNNYACDFTVLVGNSTVFPAESIVPEGTTSAMDTAAYERALRIQEYLGVELRYVIMGDRNQYVQSIIVNVQSGVDDYQLALTDPVLGLSELITSELLYDIAALESVNLNKPYWATDMMDEILIHGQYLLGYQDLCLMAADVVVFDKALAAEWNLGSPYEYVLNQTWTLERLMEMSARVYHDADGDGRVSEYDLYGTSIWSRENLNSFIPASDTKILSLADNGTYTASHLETSEKLYMLVDRIANLYESMHVNVYAPPGTTGPKFPNATSLFYLCNTHDLDSIKKKEIDFGILPYPKFDEDQVDYRSRSQNGFMCVPKSIMNPDMVGDVLELMGYYSTDVKDAYYEQLLGTRTADAPDDTRMLDIIWESQVTDMGFILRVGSSSMNEIVSMLPIVCETGKSAASLIKSNLAGSEKMLEELFGQ